MAELICELKSILKISTDVLAELTEEFIKKYPRHDFGFNLLNLIQREKDMNKKKIFLKYAKEYFACLEKAS